MIFSYKGKCFLDGTYLDLSADLSFILEHYFSVIESEFGEEVGKALFESTLKTALELKKTEENKNGKDET